MIARRAGVPRALPHHPPSTTIAAQGDQRHGDVNRTVPPLSRPPAADPQEKCVFGRANNSPETKVSTFSL
jgi:hypothetical protein